MAPQITNKLENPEQSQKHENPQVCNKMREDVHNSDLNIVKNACKAPNTAQPHLAHLELVDNTQPASTKIEAPVGNTENPERKAELEAQKAHQFVQSQLSDGQKKSKPETAQQPGNSAPEKSQGELDAESAHRFVQSQLADVQKKEKTETPQGQGNNAPPEKSQGELNAERAHEFVQQQLADGQKKPGETPDAWTRAGNAYNIGKAMVGGGLDTAAQPIKDLAHWAHENPGKAALIGGVGALAVAGEFLSGGTATPVILAGLAKLAAAAPAIEAGAAVYAAAKIAQTAKDLNQHGDAAALWNNNGTMSPERVNRHMAQIGQDSAKAVLATAGLAPAAWHLAGGAARYIAGTQAGTVAAADVAPVIDRAWKGAGAAQSVATKAPDIPGTIGNFQPVAQAGNQNDYDDNIR